MASFIGTPQEFRRYIGPRLRNLVNQITRKHKNEVSTCEHCGSLDNLESAHVKGRGRKEIIDLVLKKFTNADIVTIDLQVFENHFLAEHEPIENTILVLCRDCHVKYDSEQATMPAPIVKTTKSKADQSKETLQIILDPSDTEVFKEKLLETRKAIIEITYSDGRIEQKIWVANNFSETSNVVGNLRSRPEFRPGEWQKLGIEKVSVRVKE